VGKPKAFAAVRVPSVHPAMHPLYLQGSVLPRPELPPTARLVMDVCHAAPAFFGAPMPALPSLLSEYGSHGYKYSFHCSVHCCRDLSAPTGWTCSQIWLAWLHAWWVERVSEPECHTPFKIFCLAQHVHAQEGISTKFVLMPLPSNVARLKLRVNIWADRPGSPRMVGRSWKSSHRRCSFPSWDLIGKAA